MDTLGHVARWASDRHGRFVRELTELVRFASVSAQPRHARHLEACASWLAAHLAAIGLEDVEVIETAGPPVVHASWLRAPGAPTVLIYGHYDVQPPEPIADWRTPPFHPVVRGGRLYGRGASDDKGQMFVHVKALEAWLHSTGRLPVNVRCVFEGEEEVGSSHLTALIEATPGRFAADVALASDSPMSADGRPAITYSLRGALSVEIDVRRGGRDVHSGAYGGAIDNALQTLCAALAAMHEGGRVAIPGFYDRVQRIADEERAYMARTGPNPRDLLAGTGAAIGAGEPGFSPYERIAIRPALTINGVAGGYRGPGAKAVIPARAAAKLNFRLVPDQDPLEVERQLRAYIRDLTPPAATIAVHRQMVARPVVVDRSHPVMQIAARACLFGFGSAPRFLRAGGTIPVISAFTESLGAPVVLMGFALPEDALHGPNESFDLTTFKRAVSTSIAFLDGVGDMAAAGRARSFDFRRYTHESA
jgi:acetylornithine deacetylase/succinyl-diaminopimelate desuccinylase-like protein